MPSMVNANKTFIRTFGQPISFTVIALMSIGTSLFAQGQWAEDASSSSDFFQSGEFAACGCDKTALSEHSDRKHQRRSGPVLLSKQNAALLGHRETPPGNMGLHFPYHATNLYYYRRPYNDYHVPGHLAETKGSSAESMFGENQGYSNHVFEQAHESAELQFNAGIRAHEEDGLLEYVDWESHQKQRQNWEATLDYHVDVEQSAQPFSTPSHRPLEKSKRPADDPQTVRVEADDRAPPVPPEQGPSIRPASSKHSFRKFKYRERN